MIMLSHVHRKTTGLISRFREDRRGSSAVEFAIVSTPFLFLLLAVVQLGVFYMTQSALESGVIRTAITLRTNFTTGTTATLPDAGSLKSSVVSNGGAMINNDGNLAVEIRQLTSLTSGSVAIVDGTSDYGTNTSTLVLRAKASVTPFAPGFSSLMTVYSSALVRRQGT
jgi:Flp pilus assembly protein TadG